MSMNDQDFYIGWQSKAPQSFSKHVRKAIALLFIAVAIAAIVLALFQKKFPGSKFEYGQLTEVKGIFQKYPVPTLKVISSSDALGHTTYITMPLVGYGKSGAEGIIAELEKENNTSFDNKQLTFRGTLIYNDGKTILQIDKHDYPMLKIQENPVNIKPVIKELGNVELNGEILDPKCYFGAMKPGHGKPHLDCAVRCVEGGISPVFCVRNENGEPGYYLLLGSEGEKINRQLKDFIAEPVSIKARAVQYDDWIVLYLDKNEKIKRTGGLSWFKTDIACKPSR